MPAADDAIIYPTRSIVQPSDYLTAKVVLLLYLFAILMVEKDLLLTGGMEQNIRMKNLNI